VNATASSAPPHAGRFRTVMAALVGLGIAALLVAGALLATGRTRTAPAAAWSAWAPVEGGLQGAQEIADYVAPFYRISSTDQLAVVTVVDLESAAQQATAAQAAASGTTTPAPSGALQVAVHPSADSSAISLLGGNTIAYDLCGVGGHNCSIGVGTPSSSRLLLLRREALELALYTFHYLPSTENVVALLPPGHAISQPTSVLSPTLPTSTASATTTPVNLAILFQRAELAPLLEVPLRESLPEQVPPTVAQMPSAPEAGLVEQATARGMFTEQIQQAQDGSSLLVLNPQPPS
jgi:hypothetical protein